MIKKFVCDSNHTNKELFDALKGIPNSKSPANDGLRTELCESFWEELKNSFINTIKLVYQKKALSSYQINWKKKKKDRGNTLLKNLRSIFLLTVDLKIISKAFASRLNTVLPSIISLE